MNASSKHSEYLFCFSFPGEGREVTETESLGRATKLTLNKTVGRDKLLRTIQYYSRFYAWYLYRTNQPQSAIDPYNAVKKQFGTTRKVLRIGKFLEHLKAAALALDNKSPLDPVLRYLAVGRQLGYAGYLSLDAITVIDAIGFRKLESAKTLQENAYRSWAAGLLCSALAGVYTLFRLQEKAKTINLKEGEGAVEAKKLEKYATPFLFYQTYILQCSADHLISGNPTLPGYSSSPICATWPSQPPLWA